MRPLIWVISLQLLLSCAKEKAEASVSAFHYNVGDRTVEVRKHSYGNTDTTILYLVIHDDENTALEAGLEHIKRYGGQLLELRYGEGRMISMRYNGRITQFDPNRMFTEQGIRSNLQLLGRDTSSANIIRTFADQLFNDHISNKRLVIALHNNTNNAFSLKSYMDDKYYQQQVKSTYWSNGTDPDHFVYTTLPAVFDHMKNNGINAVLQNNATVADDGSLSIVCSRKGIGYVNIEAEDGNIDAQRSILEILQPWL